MAPQRLCPDGGIIVPTVNVIAGTNTEVYCGTYLSPINGDRQPGVVYGECTGTRENSLCNKELGRNENNQLKKSKCYSA